MLCIESLRLASLPSGLCDEPIATLFVAVPGISRHDDWIGISGVTFLSCYLMKDATAQL